MRWPSWTWTSVVLLGLIGSAYAAEIAIDWGAQNIKIAYHKRSQLDLVLNKESQRKTPAIIAIKDDERLHGNDAVAWVPFFFFCIANGHFLILRKKKRWHADRTMRTLL